MTLVEHKTGGQLLEEFNRKTPNLEIPQNVSELKLTLGQLWDQANVSEVTKDLADILKTGAKVIVGFWSGVYARHQEAFKQKELEGQELLAIGYVDIGDGQLVCVVELNAKLCPKIRMTLRSAERMNTVMQLWENEKNEVSLISFEFTEYGEHAGIKLKYELKVDKQGIYSIQKKEPVKQKKGVKIKVNKTEELSFSQSYS